MEINIFDSQNEDTPWNLLCDPYTKNGNEKDSWHVKSILNNTDLCVRVTCNKSNSESLNCCENQKMSKTLSGLCRNLLLHLNWAARSCQAGELVRCIPL